MCYSSCSWACSRSSQTATSYNLLAEYDDVDGELALRELQDVDGEFALRELQEEILSLVTVLAVDAVPGYIARQLSELSLEERQKYLVSFRKDVARTLREIGSSYNAEEGIDLFVKYMNERGIYFE